MEETKEARRARGKQVAASMMEMVNAMRSIRFEYNYQQRRLRRAKIFIDSFQRSIKALATAGSRHTFRVAFDLRERGMKSSVEKLKRLLEIDRREERQAKRRRIES